jgi:cytochrome P450
LAGAKGSARDYLLNFTLKGLSDERTQAKVEGSGKESFLSKFMAKHAKDPQTFTREHAISGCLSNVSAGSGTTAISLSSMLHVLFLNPDCLQRLQGEVDSLHAQGQLSRNPTFKET